MLSRNSHRAFVFPAFSPALFLLTYADDIRQRVLPAASLAGEPL